MLPFSTSRQRGGGPGGESAADRQPIGERFGGETVSGVDPDL